MIENFIHAARLRTLPLSISGIIVGSFLAASEQVFNWKICVLALLTTIGFQVLSNYANDYGDGIRGTDTNRTGEKRLVSSGVVSPKQMKQAVIITTLITLLIALSLIFIAFGTKQIQYLLLFFVLGIASIIAAIKYTVGKNAYGYTGFGDLFVFLFFGLLSVGGSYFLYVKQFQFAIFLPAISVGLLSTAVLNLNNMRDRESDKKANKKTLVVKIGTVAAKKYQYLLIIFSFVFALWFVLINYKNPMQFIFVLAYFPLVKHLIVVFKNSDAAQLDGELKKVALSTFLFGILFGLGQVL